MKLHRKKMIILAAAAAMTAYPVTALAASDSMADQLNRMNSLYSSMRGITTSASPNTNSSLTNSSTTNSTATTTTGPGSSGSYSTTTNNSGSNNSSNPSTVVKQNGITIENNTAANSTSGSNSSGTTTGSLPSKKIIALSEQYYEDYAMYEEGIDGQFYFYSNIGNGQITDQSVYIDFPANLTYTAELNGQPITYISKQPMTTQGTYVFRITAIYKEGTSLSQQTEYQTTFRFRIQDKPVQKKTQETAQETTSAAENSGSSYVWNSSNSSESIPLIDKAEDVAEALESKSLPLDYIRKSISEGSITLDQMASMLGVTSDALQEYLEMTAETEDTSSDQETDKTDSAGETSEGSEENTEASSETVTAKETETLEEAEKIAEAAAGRKTGSGLRESIDPLTGEYLETLFTGTKFGVSVQNGATVNGSVSFRFPSENTLAISVTRNGEPYEYTVGNDFTESGWYCMDLSDTVAGYDEIYDGKEKPRFYFQIINDPVRILEVLFVPQGEAVKKFTWNGIEQNDHGTWVSLPYSGTYEVTYTTASGKDTTVTIEKDNRPPKLNIAVSHSHATISTDDNSDRIYIYRNGELVDSGEGGSISGAGNYQVYAVDAAGNSSTQTFKLARPITPASIVAVLLLMVLGSGGAGYVIWIKRNTSMR